MLSDLLKNEFVSHYGITSHPLDVDSMTTTDGEFDLYDCPSPMSILPLGSPDGMLSLRGNSETLEIVHYEDFINQCKKPRNFQEGRKRCDFVVLSTEPSRKHVILAELTSALGGVGNLTMNIEGNGNESFGKGKYEKAEKQLAESLNTLMEVPEIRVFFEGMQDKQCIMGYKIEPYHDPVKRMEHPMNRFLEIESQETGVNGAVIANETINGYGFTFRRINHKSYYQL